jgi:hypothetical protein
MLIKMCHFFQTVNKFPFLIVFCVWKTPIWGLKYKMLFNINIVMEEHSSAVFVFSYQTCTVYSVNDESNKAQLDGAY